MKKILTGIIIVAIFIVGYFVFLRQIPVVPVSITNEQQNIYTEITPVLADISDWETYRNEKYGFEFKYPNNFNVAQNDGDGSSPDIGWIMVYCIDRNNRNSSCYSEYMDIYIYPISVNISTPQTLASITRTIEHAGYIYKFATREVHQYTSKSPIEDRGPTIDANLAEKIISTFKFIPSQVLPQ